MSKKRFKLEFVENVPLVVDYEENLAYGVIEYADLFAIASAFEKIKEVLDDD